MTSPAVLPEGVVALLTNPTICTPPPISASRLSIPSAALLPNTATTFSLQQEANQHNPRSLSTVPRVALLCNDGSDSKLDHLMLGAPWVDTTTALVPLLAWLVAMMRAPVDTRA